MAVIIGRVNVLDVMVITALGYRSRMQFQAGLYHVLTVNFHNKHIIHIHVNVVEFFMIQ